jgi:nucleoside-diphosphate-sugar epimerase
MRVVVVGASGNVGTSTLRALAAAPEVESISALARRLPELEVPKVEWTSADVVSDELASRFRGAAAVIHLAWIIQPSRAPEVTTRANVDGSARVFRAVAEAKAPALVYASSVGAYAKGPKDRAVDESWPTEGIAGSYYSRQKAVTERLLDRFESEHATIRVARLRPGLTFKDEAATEIRRFFLGPFAPNPLFRKKLVPVIPDVPGLRFQAVHSDDVGDAYRRATLGDASGAFNLAADPVLDPPTLAHALGARTAPLPRAALRSAAALSWHLRLQPTSPGWIEMALGVPIMDTRRAREGLGWRPRKSAIEAIEELLDGICRGSDYPTPPLARSTSGRLRAKEIRAGVGARPLG